VNKKNIFPLGVLCLFVAMVLSDKIMSSSTTKDETSISLDVELNEGYVAFIANENGEQDPTPKPDPDPAKCPCKGTGNITHGDGHVTPCPYHKKEEESKKCKCDTDSTYCNCVKVYGKCNCVKRSSPNSKLSSSSSDDREPVASALMDSFPFLPDKQVVWFTASWCGPCQIFKNNEVPKLKDQQWRVSEDKNAHIKIIDVDKHSGLYEKYGGGRGLPTFILFVNKQEVASIVGLTTAAKVASMYNKEKTD
jgi:thiol-disulfide isomerase/thioredoxin